MVSYTFAATEAWARERGLSRPQGETALEFAHRVGDEVPALEEDLLKLAGLLARAAYGPGTMPVNTAAVVRLFWEKLERVSVAPLSA